MLIYWAKEILAYLPLESSHRTDSGAKHRYAINTAQGRQATTCKKRFALLVLLEQEVYLLMYTYLKNNHLQQSPIVAKDIGDKQSDEKSAGLKEPA